MKSFTDVSRPQGLLAAAAPAPGWKAALGAAVRDPAELIRLLRLPDSCLEPARRAARRFPLTVPASFIARMRPEDPADPLLRQVLPLDLEEDEVEGFTADPVGDGDATLLPGAIQKYRGRVLLITAGTCAINCRYCFRREFPYGDAPRGMAAWAPAVARIQADPGVSEVILSGGDPLVLTDASLARLASALAEVPHLQRLRVHTRLPIVIPERVTDELIGWLKGTRLTPFVVVHSNHPAELTGDCAEALGRLADAGIPVLNQAVLLRGVNDDPDTMARLSESLINLRVLPYYLHQLDPVRGSAHFHVSETQGLQIIEELRRRLPGYAVPRYVKEVAGGESKEEVRRSPGP